CRRPRRRRGDRVGAARRRRPARDSAAEERRARRAACARIESRRHVALTGEQTPIVLPDDPHFGPDVQLDYPGYRSTRWRAPDRPLVTLPEELHRLEGPVFGEDAVGEHDNDLTRQHEDDPLGERIVVTGRVLDEDGRPIDRKSVV